MYKTIYHQWFSHLANCKINALGMNYVIKIAHSFTRTYKHINSAETDDHNMSIIQSRHEDSVRLSDCISTSQICSLSLKKPMQSQVQRGQKCTVKACSSSAGARVLLKVTPSFSCLDRRTMSKQLASKMTWQAPRFSSPLQADVLGLSSNTFHQETDLRSDPLAECKKAPNVCTFPSSNQSTLTVLARDGASRQERPNVLRHLASVQKKTSGKNTEQAESCRSSWSSKQTVRCDFSGCASLADQKRSEEARLLVHVDGAYVADRHKHPVSSSKLKKPRLVDGVQAVLGVTWPACRPGVFH